MDRNTIIDGLKMTMELCVFDPSTGEEIKPHLLNDINRATYDACKGALEILERLDTDPDTISRQAAIDALGEKPLAWIEGEYETGLQNQWESDVEALKDMPSAQPEIIRCRDCKLRDTEYCNMAHGFMGMKDDDYCSYAERREVSE